MAVKSKEFEAVVAAVFEDDDGTVVERAVVVHKGMNGGVERSGHGRAGVDEEIDAQVNGAALVGRIRTAAKEGRGVNSAWLVVTANSDGFVSSARGCVNFGSHG